MQKYEIEHTLLFHLHQEIHILVRLVTTALLFEKEPSIFFEEKIRHVVENLLSTLLPLYEENPNQKIEAIINSLLQDIQDLGPIFHSDIEAALDNDPATNDVLEIVLCYPGCKAVRYYRIAHIFYRHKIPLLPRMIAELSHEITGIDIHPGAKISTHFFIDHGTGVVIGETAVIGSRVTLYQGVTLGAKRIPRDSTGAIIHGQIRHPTIEDGVTIYSGATILGPICIGKQSIIGGNVWLTEDVPAYSRVTQQRYHASSFSHGDGI